MLNKQRHQLLMGRILRDIYMDVSMAPLLGLKGGTCAYFFYDLPRFSVALDFDLLKPEENTREYIFAQIEKIIQKYGQIKNKYIKRNTIFMLLSYGERDHNIKIEISTRQTGFPLQDQYTLKEHLGISMLVAKQDYLVAGKLSALILRKTTAMRDIYDIHYFLHNNAPFNPSILTDYTGKSPKESLLDAAQIVEEIPDSRLLEGLGELVDTKEKHWIKKHLKEETIFLLKNYIATL